MIDWLTLLIIGIIVVAIGYIIKRVIADHIMQVIGYVVMIIGAVMIIISLILLTVGLIN